MKSENSKAISGLIAEIAETTEEVKKEKKREARRNCLQAVFQKLRGVPRAAACCAVALAIIFGLPTLYWASYKQIEYLFPELASRDIHFFVFMVLICGVCGGIAVVALIIEEGWR